MKTKVYYGDVSCLDSDALFQSRIAQVSTDRRKKIERLRFRKDKNLSLGAGLILEHGLKDFGFSLENAGYRENEFGKPFLELPHLYFNLSHSGTKVLCVFSDCPVGCDVEKIRKADLKLAKHSFSDAEYRFLCTLSPSDFELYFYRLWTLKESYIKGIGKGLSFGLKNFTIEFSDTGAKLCPDEYLESFDLEELFLDTDYCSAIASKKRIEDLELIEVDFAL